MVVGGKGGGGGIGTYKESLSTVRATLGARPEQRKAEAELRKDGEPARRRALHTTNKSLVSRTLGNALESGNPEYMRTKISRYKGSTPRERES